MACQATLSVKPNRFMRGMGGLTLTFYVTLISGKATGGLFEGVVSDGI